MVFNKGDNNMAQIPKLPSLANGAGALIAAPPSSRKGGPRVNQSKRRMVPVPDAIARAVVVSSRPRHHHA